MKRKTKIDDSPVASKKLYTLDLETDPFEQGKRVYPFASCIYDGETYWKFWGANCVPQLVEKMRELPPGIVYAHNGGRFDFFYFWEYADKNTEPVIIHNRLTQFWMEKFDMRDSFKLFPFALSAYKKTEISYEKFYENCREIYKEEILQYLGDDCRDLYEMVSAYHLRFGDSLTIGTTAFNELKARHDIGPTLSAAWDGHIRDNYYFGGRVQRFEKGVYDGSFSVYDINSAYPYVMRDFRHPIGTPRFGSNISQDTFFVRCRGKNEGAFPLRTKTGLTFQKPYGEFCVTIHEFNEALALGKFRCDKVTQTIDFENSLSFTEFINHFYGLRVEADERGDKIHKMMYKFLLNNSYGKFSINPENYKDYSIMEDTEGVELCDCPRTQRECTCGKWEMVRTFPTQGFTLYCRPSKTVRRMNIATGASITGATRSVLLRGLANATRLFYCDTDSIIAERLDNIPIGSKELGAWKLEATGNRLAIAGRKMYALFNSDHDTSHPMGFEECLKMASKGVRISPEQIKQVANGATVTYNQDAPIFCLDGSVKFLSRDVRSI